MYPVESAFYIPISFALYRWYYNYDYRKKRYDATFAQLLYDNNLSNNIGEFTNICLRKITFLISQ